MARSPHFTTRQPQTLLDAFEAERVSRGLNESELLYEILTKALAKRIKKMGLDVRPLTRGRPARAKAE